ncbi:glutathione S-transferase Mu 5-like isoform X3 [Ascaphus truei]|uniref:glutathione S-transferase Mu 5-like isoform X3 n=1 Tax=Ascaphus truei TaxID=8439 RepID=UPI003F5A1DC5
MLILGYWNIRGMAHSIRLLLEYTGTLYQEKLYVTGDAPDYDQSQWLDEKEKLGLDFPNLPYLLDEDVKLTQSNAILRYIARKHGLCGQLEGEKIRVDLMENQVMDFRMALHKIAYNPLFETRKGQYLEKLPVALSRFSRFLGDGAWFAGEKITFADFLMYDVLDQHQVLEPQCLQNLKNLQDFLTRLEALPPVAAYITSPHFKKTPINNRMAAWANCTLFV